MRKTVFLSFAMTCALLAGSAQAKPECRIVMAGAGQNKQTTSMCQGPDGNFTTVTDDSPPATDDDDIAYVLKREARQENGGGTIDTAPSSEDTAQPSYAAFAPNFQGQVVYDGRFNTRRTIAAKAPSGTLNGNGRGLTLNLQNLFDGDKVTEFSGTVQFVANYDGDQVRVTHRQNGEARAITMTGTRHGDTCKIIAPDGEWLAHCGPDGFIGTFATWQGRNPSFQVSFDAATTRVTTKAQLDRQMAEAQAAQAAAVAEQDRQQAAARAEQARISSVALNRSEQQPSSKFRRTEGPAPVLPRSGVVPLATVSNESSALKYFTQFNCVIRDYDCEDLDKDYVFNNPTRDKAIQDIIDQSDGANFAFDCGIYRDMLFQSMKIAMDLGNSNNYEHADQSKYGYKVLNWTFSNCRSGPNTSSRNGIVEIIADYTLTEFSKYLAPDGRNDRAEHAYVLLINNQPVCLREYDCFFRFASDRSERQMNVENYLNRQRHRDKAIQQCGQQYSGPAYTWCVDHAN